MIAQMAGNLSLRCGIGPGYDQRTDPIGVSSALPPPCEPETAPTSIDVGLHVAPLAPLPEHDPATGRPAPYPFGCPPWLWSAELSVMALGGEAERHATLPLYPEEACDDLPDAPPTEPATLRLGSYELRVLRCVGHYARRRVPGGGAGGADLAKGCAAVVSDYPLLLLHVQLGVRRLREGAAGDDGGSVSEAQELGDSIERMLGLG